MFHLASYLKQFAAYIAYKESLLNTLSKKILIIRFFQIHIFTEILL
ncbi:hypothetical protein HPNQ4200_0598 [Helicobacter pylori NQ4200]|uniref:Uncharacterized protein n=1 Tax=Helicobacter pylori NQ4200 TaxID=992024 RepID=J0IW25_HELPX|nr:hypothetical protein HPNQ4200_0598 [Helicobacter pylori NQ4200]